MIRMHLTPKQIKSLKINLILNIDLSNMVLLKTYERSNFIPDCQIMYIYVTPRSGICH